MAKMNDNLRTACTVVMVAMAIGGIFYACGAVTHDIEDNKEDIKIVGAKADKNAEDINEAKIARERQQATAEATLGTLVRLEGKIDAQGKGQDQMKLDINSTKIKIETLTKDE